MEKTLVLISPHGFCAGVERAVETAEAVLRRYPHPVYCLREIVHNRQVIDALAAKGMIFVGTIQDIPRGATVLFSAHGISPAVREAARELQLQTVDATCPFVTKVHQEVKRYAEQGYTILLIGHRAHDEIVGVAGEAPDRVIVIANADEAQSVPVPDPDKVAMLTQTTLSLDEVAHVMDILKRRFPALRTPPESDICYATRNRQQAVSLFARRADAVIVLGTTNSSNSNRLVEVARAEGCAAMLVDTLETLETFPLAGVTTLGLTAGASTPESFVQEAITHLTTRGFRLIKEPPRVKETIHFPLPRELA